MLKKFLLFIKTHALTTAIATTIIIGTAVVTPIVVYNSNLDKTVKENLGMLVSSDFKVDDNNQLNDLQANIVENESNKNTDISQNQIDTNTPLSFRIEKIFTKTEGGNIVKDMQGNDAFEMSSNGVEYKIVPSYDKEYSKWTNEDKKAYQKVVEEVSKMVEEEYNSSITKEEENMQEALLNVQKIEASYSKYYEFTTPSEQEGWTSSESWRYNSYTKKYSGSTWLYSNWASDNVEETDISIEEFKSIVYPTLQPKIEKALKIIYGNNITDPEYKQALQKELKDLEELLSLSE